jgi:lysophospholipase L1-like esterase
MEIPMKYLVVLSLTTPCLAQSWTELPDTYTQTPCLWTGLFAQARTGIVHLGMFGDSQETCPTGRGDVYVPALSARLAAEFGTAETPWYLAGFPFGGGGPWGSFLGRSGAAAPGCTLSSRVTHDTVPPGTQLAQTSAVTGENANFDQRYGWLLMLDHDATYVNPGAQIGGVTYFDRSNGVYIDVWGRSFPGSSELTLKVTTTTGPLTYYGAYVGTYTTSMGLDDANETLKHQAFGPFYPGSARLQVEVYGNDESRVADLATVRFIAAGGHGITLSTFSDGGYRADTLYTWHANSGPYLGAIGLDAAVLTYGANDGGQGFSAQVFKDRLRTDISWLRAAVGRPDFPVIIVTDAYRRMDNPAYYAEYDLYPQVSYEIACEDAYVLFVNSRKLTDAIGWDASGYAAFLADSVHYTDFGAREKARVESEAIIRAFGCVADFNHDGFADFFDYDAFVTAFEGGDTSADTTCDGFVDFFDYDVFILAFEAGC